RTVPPSSIRWRLNAAAFFNKLSSVIRTQGAHLETGASLGFSLRHGVWPAPISNRLCANEAQSRYASQASLARLWGSRRNHLQIRIACAERFTMQVRAQKTVMSNRSY